MWRLVSLPLVMGLLFGGGRAGILGCLDDISGIETSAASTIGTVLFTTSASGVAARNAAMTFTSFASSIDSTQSKLCTQPAVSRSALN